ncbi:MAG: hypothetical protein PHI24_13400 [Desulfitobacteriaceae bacterium]|nr:hypothetical protein [Desulfitobacteriaceae bacterium]
MIFINLRKVAAPAVTLSVPVPVMAKKHPVTGTDLAVAPVAALCVPVMDRATGLDMAPVALAPDMVPAMDRVSVPVMDTKKEKPEKRRNAVMASAVVSVLGAGDSPRCS